MGYEDLEHRGIFLPASRRGELRGESSAPPLLVGAVLVSAIAGCVAMAFGGGGPWTWAGAALFGASLITFTLQADRAIDRQNRRVQRLIEGGEAD